MKISNFWCFDLVIWALGIADTVYLDHAGATIYSELQMEAIFKDLTSGVYGNPRILFTRKLVLFGFVYVKFNLLCFIQWFCIFVCWLNGW